MSDQWAIHIDAQGFGAKWDDTMEAFRGLNPLMQAIFWLGERAYPEPPERLFAHQIGDGFLVLSDFHEQTLHRAMLISVALLRHVLSHGATARAAIAEGGLSDVRGCYPPEIRRQISKDNISFGRGVMTVFPVMGTALINAVCLEKRSPSGPLLTVAASNLDRLPGDVSTIKVSESVVAINWLRSGPTGLCDLQKAARLKSHSEQERIKQLRDYIAANEGLTDQWKENAARYLLSNGI
jgi:hypothetical protein